MGSTTVEYKREYIDDIKYAVVAFANTEGGRLYQNNCKNTPTSTMARSMVWCWRTFISPVTDCHVMILMGGYYGKKR